MEFEQNTILSESRYSVLSPPDEGGVENEKLIVSQETEAGNSEENVVEETTRVNPQTEAKKKETAVIAQQSLPRDSKDNHRYLSDSAALKAKDNAPAQRKSRLAENIDA